MEHVYQLTAGLCDYASVAPCGNKLIATRHSMSQGDEIYAVEGLDSKPMPIVLFQTDSHARPNYSTDKEINSPYSVKQLTTENRHIYEQVEMGRVEGRWITTTDGKQMLVWVIYPPQFDPQKKYPALLYCEGGPQSALSQFWSYRWNFQMMAANDYIVVAPLPSGHAGLRHGMERSHQRRLWRPVHERLTEGHR